MPVWIPGVEKNVEKRVVYKQECPIQVICSRGVEAVLIKGYYGQTILSLYNKKSNKTKKDMQT